jgi:rubrerythrin
MNIRINAKQTICSIVTTGLLVGCALINPLPLPPGNAADPQASIPVKPVNDVLAHDEVTVAIQKELSQTESAAKSAESMQQTGQGDMPGMQQGEMKMDDHQNKPNAGNAEGEKKAVADEMKKTSEEMKKTSEEMKEKSEQTNSQGFYYTCRMHPQIHSDKPGKCPICGMTLIKKEGVPPK